MKKSNYLKFFLFCLSIGLVACSSDDSSDNPDPTPPATEGSFTKRVLVEDYTSVWCGNCPRVAHAIDLLGEETNKMVAVAIHGPFGGEEDPFNFAGFSTLMNEANIDGLPGKKLDKTTNWNYPEAENLNQAKAMTGTNAGIGLAINPTLDGTNLDIDLKVKFGDDFTSESLKMVVYVLENGLIADQKNYDAALGSTPTIEDYQHDHVLRASLTDLLGDAIPAGKTSLGNVYTKNISVPVSETNVSDTANMHIVAFVVDADGNALNVRSANIGAQQDFEAH